ncbi:uncharacterized protein LOC142310168 [Anomaloglossus baeobatrachus]|uniref:uncharacterized protein LOC142310168 n=1 Tax=Anomaloglossus baeobatrachus TaxID=238106 RepID=UPI003F5090C0
MEHIKQVLQLLRANKLHDKPEKCLFTVQELPFLSYIISTSGFRMDSSKLQAILKCDCPENLKALQRFLGFTNYYRKFIKTFSAISRPLTKMTKKEWSESALCAFDCLKKCFASAPVLIQPDVSLSFTVEVEASEIGMAFHSYSLSLQIFIFSGLLQHIPTQYS